MAEPLQVGSYHIRKTAAVYDFHDGSHKLFVLYGELAGNRTQDPRLKRALLYQLSYELANCRYLKVNTGTSAKNRRLAGASAVLDFKRDSQSVASAYTTRRVYRCFMLARWLRSILELLP